MFHAVYRQVARFLNWVNRTGSGSGTSRVAKDLEKHRRDFANRYGNYEGSD